MQRPMMNSVIIGRGILIACMLSPVLAAAAAPAGSINLLQSVAWHGDAGSVESTPGGLLLKGGASGGVVRRRMNLEPYAGKMVELEGTLATATQGKSLVTVMASTQAFDAPLRQVGSNMLVGPGEEGAFRLRLRVDRAAISLRTEIRLAPGAVLVLKEVQATALAAAPDLPGEGGRAGLSAGASVRLQALARAMALTRYFGQTAEQNDALWETRLRPLVMRLERPASPAQQRLLLSQAFASLAPEVRWRSSVRLLPRLSGNSADDGKVQARWGVHQVYRGFGSGDNWYDVNWQALPHTTASLAIPLAYNSLSVMLPGGREDVPPAPALHAEHTTPRHAVSDRATRLLAVMQLWGVLYYFYPDVRSEAMWQAMLAEALDAAATSPDGESLHRVLQHMLSYLEDGHAWVQGPHLRKDYVPAARLLLADGHAYIAKRGNGAACPASALTPGSEVLEIDGKNIAQRRQQLQYESKLASASAQDRADEQLVLAGPPGSMAEIVYRMQGGARQEIRLQRTIAAYALDCDAAAAPVAEIAPGMMLINLDRATDDMLATALPQLQAAHAIILDARHYIASSQQFLGHFTRLPLPGPPMLIPVLSAPGRDRWSWQRSQRTIAPLEPYIAARLFFMTGGDSISAVETYLQTARFAGLGTFIGEATAGTTGDVAGVALPGGYQAYWTGMRALRQDGSRFSSITPDIVLPQDAADAAAGVDTVLLHTIALANSMRPAMKEAP